MSLLCQHQQHVTPSLESSPRKEVEHAAPTAQVEDRKDRAVSRGLRESSRGCTPNSHTAQTWRCSLDSPGSSSRDSCSVGFLSDKLRGANEGEEMSEETVNSAVIAATIIAEISHGCTPIEAYARVMALQQVGGFLCVCACVCVES